MPAPCTDYEPAVIEPLWQRRWEETAAFRAVTGDPRPKYYILDMFPYPSGAGLHIGHPEGYTATDILARCKRAQGFNVLHPMGWDAFGLPAEQYAVKTGQHPRVTTERNIATFKRQIQAIGLGYDWEREVDTTDPRYVRWTQWIFLQLFRRGLAYVDEKPVWWCPALGTVLANEEVIDGRSEVGGFPVERRPLRQWVLRITAYADRLLAGLGSVDWPESTKRMQMAWIGRSEGAEVEFELEGALAGETLRVFTTRVDTLAGATFLVLAPEHPLVRRLTTPEQRAVVEPYVAAAAAKSDLERTDLAKDKSGVFTGSFALNPATGHRVPVWVADYVLTGYGTGAIMAVPAHDERDYAFAEKFRLPIQRVIEPADASGNGDGGRLPYVDSDGGRLVHSGDYTGLSCAEARQRIAADLAARQRGRATVQYKLRDWLFSRQRYWGEPFPIVWVSEEDYANVARSGGEALGLPATPVGGTFDGVRRVALPLPVTALPLELPAVSSYQAAGTGESPLANETDWVDIWYEPSTGASRPAREARPDGPGWIRARRETNTMPQWAGSCWYYLRFCDPACPDGPIGPQAAAYWGVPDLYVGGAEHAVLHLLYARFWHMVLHDAGVVPTAEPFPRLYHQGIILGETEFHLFLDEAGQPVSAEHVPGADPDRWREQGRARRLGREEVEKQGKDAFVWKENPAIRVDARSFKMSKSRGNVINPDEILRSHGADTLRLYEMFLGPLDQMKPWDPQGIEGVHRFLRRAWREVVGPDGAVAAKIHDQEEGDPDTRRLLHETIRKVTDDIERLRFNTAISALMVLLNQLQKAERVARSTWLTFLQLLQPFAPHLAQELAERLGATDRFDLRPWPRFDPSVLAASEVRIVVQVNGKHRGEILVPAGATEEEVAALALAQPKVREFVGSLTIRKRVFVPCRILNLVVG